jgi:hypothetical protein
LGGAVALDVVALQAAGHQVLPLITATPGTRDDVIDGARRTITVTAAVAISAEDAASGDGHMTVVGHLHVASEDDNGGSLPGAIGTSHRIALIALHDDGAAIHDKNQCSSERHDRERLIAGV